LFRRGNSDSDSDSLWYRISNYGVFHCWANTARSDDRNKLDSADIEPTFFVLLETTRIDRKEVELWAAQFGARPGSQYLLLSRTPAPGGIDSFTVLQIDCPPANVRDAKSLDILLTRYCALHSRAELTKLARRMA
jgi:hypothetical protein